MYIVTVEIPENDGLPLVTARGDEAVSQARCSDLLDVFPWHGEVEAVVSWMVVTVADQCDKGYIDLLINPDMKGGKWELKR